MFSTANRNFQQQNRSSARTDHASAIDVQQQQRMHPPAFISPQPFYYSQYGTLESNSYNAPSSSSYFDLNQADVIMDDGSRQKRSVSLSTVRQFPSIPSASSPRGTSQTTRSLASPTTFVDGTKPITAQQQLAKSRIIGTIGEDSDAGDDDDGTNSPSRLTSMIKSTALYSLLNLTTENQQVLKCSLAHLLGSLFTFVPMFHNWIDNDGNIPVATPMAATVTVFFNPAKSVGGMVEAAGIGWLMTLGALSVSLGNLWTTDFWMGTRPYLAHCVTLFVWLLTSTLSLAFLKAHYSRRQSIGPASSLAYLLLFPVIVRDHALDGSEYKWQKIHDDFAIVAIGTAISAGVCVLIWPQTATKKFNSNMNDSLSSLCVLLKLLTKTFLLDMDLPDFKANEPLTKAINTHSASFTALQSSLREARLEWWWWEDNDAHECMVKSIERLTLHIGGLRKSCGLQFDRVQQATAVDDNEEENDPHVTYNVRADNHRRKFEHAMKRERSTAPFNDNISSTAGHGIVDDEMTNFLCTVGPSMKSLAFTCKQTIRHLQTHMTPNSSVPSFATLRRNLGLALDTFEQSQQKALQRLFHRCQQSMNEGRIPRRASRLDPTPSAMQKQLLTHLPSDDVFLVYFFVFCLIAFAKELIVLTTWMEKTLQQKEKTTPLVSFVLRLIKGFRYFATTRFQPSSCHFPRNNTNNNKHTADSAPMHLRSIGFLRLCLCQLLMWIKKYQVRYAIKAGVTALLLGSLAFFPWTRVSFQIYYMEWTLITALAVMTPTVGGTNFNAVLRVGATILGVTAGALTYYLFSDFHVIVLVALTWLISLPCFWLIIHEPKYGKFGQFTLLAYNLVILYEYDHPELNVFDLAYRRFVAVSLGVVAGLVATIFKWPYRARSQLRFGLSDLLLGFSNQYYQMNSSNNQIGDERTAMATVSIPKQPQQQLGENTALLDLQRQLHHLSGLLNHTTGEPRLKGRFQFETYHAMLRKCQSILDNLVMMQMVTPQQTMNDDGGTDMVGNVVLYFYVLASALQLKTPLPPYLPPANMARKQLMNRASTETTSLHLHDAASSSPSYMAYYAYVILMETMLYDMDQLGNLMKMLYGSMMPHWQS